MPVNARIEKKDNVTVINLDPDLTCCYTPSNEFIINGKPCTNTKTTTSSSTVVEGEKFTIQGGSITFGYRKSEFK